MGTSVVIESLKELKMSYTELTQSRKKQILFLLIAFFILLYSFLPFLNVAHHKPLSRCKYIAQNVFFSH
jgi:hypothetical protein